MRPYAYDLLKSLQKNYQVVVFTSSHQAYADPVLDALEAELLKPKYLTKEERQLVNAAPKMEQMNVVKKLK